MIQTNLESTAAANFDGTENILVGVTGILPIENGGTGNLRGNAISANKLETARAISITDGVNTGTATNFDGTENITVALPATIKADLSGNATSANKLETERQISITDGVNTGAATNFDGTENIAIKLPATIKATLNGNADTATRANQDSDGNIIAETYMPKISSAALTIPIDGWIEDDAVPFNRYFDFEISSLTADDVVNIVISPNNQGLCVDCGLCPTCEIFNGILRFRAKSTPTADISAEFYILKGASNGKIKSFGSVNCSTSQRVVIYKTPSQIDNLTFNGKIQTPTWDDYDPTKLLIIGEISGVNADTYTVNFIPIGNCTWSTDTREPRSQTWKINRAIIDEIPSQGEILTYNGEPQTPTLNNFDAEKMTLSGDFQNLVDAGMYTAYATPTENYMFSDTSITATPFKIFVEKATQNISLSQNSVALENILMSDTIIVNRQGDGVIYATSNDSAVATAINADSEVTISAVATGKTSILINVAEGKNYLSASATLPVETFVIKPLAECTVDEIVTAIQSGKAKNAWDEGDLTSPITLNGKIGDALTLDNLQICAKLIGFNHNSEIESSGNFSAHFIFDTALVDTNYGKASISGVKYFQHNVTTGSNVGGWNSSNLRDICTDIFNALPTEWQNIISPCAKYTDNSGGGVDDSNFVTPTADKIFLLSEYEVFGRNSYANSAEPNFQMQYEYFKNGNSKVFNSQETACNWWLRSAQKSNGTSFCRVSDEGGLSTYNARFSQGVTPAFMIS